MGRIIPPFPPKRLQKSQHSKKETKCRAHNKELIYCKDCVKVLNAIEIVRVLRWDFKEQNKAYREALEILKGDKK